MEQGVLRVNEISEEVDFGMMGLALIYSRFYTESGRNFINCFLKFPSIRSACQMIVHSSKRDGSFNECKGKDFTGYVEKLNLESKWKPVLADILLIIYSITRPDIAPDVDTKEV